jgi:ribosomal protein L37AE/L43A
MTEVYDCPECGKPFESLHSAGQHGWKSADHDADSLDAALAAVVEHNDAIDMSDDTDTDTDDTVTSGNGTVENDSTAESGEQPPTVTDGESTTPDGNDTTGDGTATDGGERFPTPSAADDAVDGDPDDAGDETEPCPACGEPLPVEGVEPGVYQCSNCKQPVRVTA